MEDLLAQITDIVGTGTGVGEAGLIERDGKQDLFRLVARCNLKLGQWQATLVEETNPVRFLDTFCNTHLTMLLLQDKVPDLLRFYQAATHFDKTWYKAWHAWALANFEAAAYYERKHDTIPARFLVQHVIPAVQGFFRSIALSKGNSLQDALRLLTLWFKYGSHQEVNNAVGEGFGGVSIDTWLQVIPQLIARIHTQSPHVRKLIHDLLGDIGKQHPQALIYPLTVASKSVNMARKKAAQSIMDKMRSHSAALVDQVCFPLLYLLCLS